jgi:hypothetical protein
LEKRIQRKGINHNEKDINNKRKRRELLEDRFFTHPQHFFHQSKKKKNAHSNSIKPLLSFVLGFIHRFVVFLFFAAPKKFRIYPVSQKGGRREAKNRFYMY